MAWPFTKKKTEEELRIEEEEAEKRRIWEERRPRVKTEAARQPRYALTGARGSDPIFHKQSIKSLETNLMDTSALINAAQDSISRLRSLEVQMRVGSTKPTLVGRVVSGYIYNARMLDRNYAFGQIYARMSIITNSLNSGIDGISFITKKGIYKRVKDEYSVWQTVWSDFKNVQDAYLSRALKIVSDAWKKDSSLERFSQLHVFHDALLRLQDKKEYLKYAEARKILVFLNRTIAVGLKKGDKWKQITENPDLWKKNVRLIHETVVKSPNPRLRLGFELNNEFVKVNDSYHKYVAAYNGYKQKCEEVNKEFNDNVENGLDALQNGIESGKYGNIMSFQTWLAQDYISTLQKATAEKKNTVEFEEAYGKFNETLDDLHYYISRVMIETRKLRNKSDEVAGKLVGLKLVA
jgi:hypothetical protein